MSSLSKLGGAFIVHHNNLTSVTNPNSSEVFEQYNVSNNRITGTLDLSMLSNLGGYIAFHINDYLTSILLPNSNRRINTFHAYSCKLSILDVRSLSRLGGDFQAQNNTDLTSILLPNSSEKFTIFYANNCPILDYVSFWPISGSSSSGIEIRLNNNNWTAAIVNHVLVDLDQIGWTLGTLYIGDTNAAPDSTSGGYNGTAALSSLASKTWNLFYTT